MVSLGAKITISMAKRVKRGPHPGPLPEGEGEFCGLKQRPLESLVFLAGFGFSGSILEGFSEKPTPHALVFLVERWFFWSTLVFLAGGGRRRSTVERIFSIFTHLRQFLEDF